MTYSSYLRLDDLLTLQSPLSDDADGQESMFIIAHQASELWFKVILADIDLLADALSRDEASGAANIFRRMANVVRALICHVDVLDSISPESFNAIRPLLGKRSARESSQFAEILCSLGQQNGDFLDLHPKQSAAYLRLKGRMEAPTVVDALHDHLGRRCGVAGLGRRLSTDGASLNKEVQDKLRALLESERDVRILLDAIARFDKSLLQWRMRHIQLAARLIGDKPGTGGTSGVKYLQESLSAALFPEILSMYAEYQLRNPAALYDISPTISMSTPVWPGDTPLSRNILCEIGPESGIELSTLQSTVHIGAHADAPSHYSSDGETIEQRPLSPYLGPCQVMRLAAQRGTRISEENLVGPILAERVLLATDTFPNPNQFNPDFAALAPSLVRFLHEAGVRLIGIDTPSVDLFECSELLAHRVCKEHDMAILEGLRLDHVPQGLYELIALPLPLEGFDASPVRAVLRLMPPD